MRRGRQRRIKNLKWDIIALFSFCIIVLQIQFSTDRLAPRYVLHVHVFCLQCLVVKFCSVPVRCLKDTSWKVATDEIICLLQSHLQFRIGSSPTRIWGNTLRPALTASRLFMIWRAPSSFPHTRAALLTIRCPQKKIVWGQNNFCW